MRRKINPQIASYVQDNDLVCFGLSEHVVDETFNNWTPQARKEIAALASWFPKRNTDNVTRPVYKSTYNQSAAPTRANLRCILAFLFIRELPIKNFYTRMIIGYVYCKYFIFRGVGRGLTRGAPIFHYNNDYHMKGMMNHPDLFWWNLTHPLPKNPPVPETHLEWRLFQTPAFHQAHKNVYRYRYRLPRYVQWDGSMSQPCMPYLHDHGTDVPNGTFRRNCNSDPQLR